MMSKLTVLLRKEFLELWHTKKMILICLLFLLYPFFLNVIASKDAIIPVNQGIPLLTTITAALSGEIVFSLMLQERNNKTMDLLLISKVSHFQIMYSKVLFAVCVSMAITFASIIINNLLIRFYEFQNYIILTLNIRFSIFYVFTAMVSAMLVYLLFWLPIKSEQIKKYCTISQLAALLISGLLAKIYFDLRAMAALTLIALVLYALAAGTLQRMSSYHEIYHEKPYRNVYSECSYTVFGIIYHRIWHQIKYDRKRLLSLGVLILGPFAMHAVTRSSWNSLYFSFLTMILCSFFSINYLFLILEEDSVSKNFELFLIANMNKRRYALYHIFATTWFNLLAVLIHLGLAFILNCRWSGIDLFISFITIVSASIISCFLGHDTKDYKTSRIYSALIFGAASLIYLVLNLILL